MATSGNDGCHVSQAIRTHTEYDHVPFGLMAQLLRALHRCRRVHALESLPSLNFFLVGSFHNQVVVIYNQSLKYEGTRTL